MDYPSLLSAQLLARPAGPGTGPDAEERYWRKHVKLPRPGLRLLVPLATTAGVILTLLGIAQA